MKVEASVHTIFIKKNMKEKNEKKNICLTHQLKGNISSVRIRIAMHNASLRPYRAHILLTHMHNITSSTRICDDNISEFFFILTLIRNEISL